MQHKRKRSEMRIKFQSENMKKKDHLQDLGIDRRIILKGTVKKKWVAGGWTRLISLRTGTSGRLL